MVYRDAVGLEDVVGHCAEPFGVAALGQIDFHDPFEAVARGATEEEAGLELSVGFQVLEEVFKMLYVVEVQAEKSAVLDELVFFAGIEGAGEGAVVKAVCFERARFPFVLDAPEVQGAALGVAAGDVVEGVLQGNLLVWDGVADGCFVEGEMGFLGEGRLEEKALLGLFAKVEVEFLIDDLQEFVSGFLVVHLCEVQERAVGDVAGGVVMPADAVWKPCAVGNLLHPDVEALARVVPGILDPATFISLYVHQRLVRVEAPENVGVDGGAVMGVADDVFAGEMAVFGNHRLSHPAGVDIVDGFCLDFLGGGGTAGLGPDVDLILAEEQFFRAFVVGDEFVVDPAVNGGLGGMVREVGAEFRDSEPDDAVFIGLKVLLLFGLRVLQFFFNAVEAFNDVADGPGDLLQGERSGGGCCCVLHLCWHRRALWL